MAGNQETMASQNPSGPLQRGGGISRVRCCWPSRDMRTVHCISHGQVTVTLSRANTRRVVGTIPSTTGGGPQKLLEAGRAGPPCTDVPILPRGTVSCSPHPLRARDRLPRCAPAAAPLSQGCPRPPAEFPPPSTGAVESPGRERPGLHVALPLLSSLPSLLVAQRAHGFNSRVYPPAK